MTAAFFECVGKVTAVRISVTRDSADGMNRAWVEFESERAAREALEYSGKVQCLAPSHMPAIHCSFRATVHLTARGLEWPCGGDPVEA